MARVHYVKAARVGKRGDTATASTGKHCIECHVEIKAGEPYKYATIRAGKFARGRMLVWCSKHNPKPSQMTSSDKLAMIYSAQEDAEANIASWTGEDGDASDLKSHLEAAAESIREAAEAYRESATNIEDGFGHSTSMSDELNEKADTIESAADDLENTDFEDFDEDAARTEATDEVTNDCDEHPDEPAEAGDCATCDLWREAVEELVNEKREEWADEQRSAASDALSNVEVG